MNEDGGFVVGGGVAFVYGSILSYSLFETDADDE